MNDSHASSSACGERLGACFGLAQVPRTIRIERTSIAVTNISCDWENNGLTAPIPVDDAFLLTLQLCDTARHHLWIDGHSQKTAPLHRGSISIYDLRTSPMVNSVSAFRNMHFYIPRDALNAVATREGFAEVEDLPNEPGLGMDDPILAGLGLSLEWAFDTPSALSTLFFDHVTSAMLSRLVRAHGARPPQPTRSDLTLSAAQASRVKDMLVADLSGDITMGELAASCDLSISEFRTAFKRATGLMPHQWLMTERIKRAQNLLRTTHLSLLDVARFSNFADIRQMRRIFAVALGASPESIRAG